jgi:dolichol-phosphate mannosyltransferase
MAFISIVIPVYKAEHSLPVLYQRLKNTLEIISDEFEIILVEDCGGDRSWECILELARLDPRVKGLQLSRNFGQHYAITAGLDHCHGDWVVVMDCDLQDQPEEIPRLLQKALEGYDVVLANRGKRQDPLPKRLLSQLFYKIFNYFLDMNYNGEAGNFRIISRKVVLTFRQMRENLRFFGGLVAWMGFKTTSIEVQHAKSFDGKSTYTFKKLFKLASDAIIAYSDKPLRLSIYLGFLMSFFALLYGTYILIQALLQKTVVMGWASLIVSIYFIGGVIIAILGIIGIYLGKTFDETKKRPLYIISKST